MAGGKGAAVGDHEQTLGQGQVMLKQLEMLMDGGVAVLVAAEHMSENGDGAELVDDRGGADLDHFLVLDLVAVRDVSGIDERGRSKRHYGYIRSTWLRGRIAAFEEHMGGIEVNAFEGQFGQSQGMHGGGGLNGMPLVEEGVEGSAQTVVVELVGRDVPQQFRPGFLGPLSDVDQGGGLGEPGRQQQAENVAVRKFQLGVGRQMTIDDASEIEPIQEWRQHGERSDVENGGSNRRASPGESGHKSSLRESRNDTVDSRRTIAVHPHSRRAVKAEEKKSVCSGSHNHLRIITATSCSLSTRPTIVSRVAENRVNQAGERTVDHPIVHDKILRVSSLVVLHPIHMSITGRHGNKPEQNVWKSFRGTAHCASFNKMTEPVCRNRCKCLTSRDTAMAA